VILKTSVRLTIIVYVLLGLGSVATSQETPAQDSARIISFLNQTIEWYREQVTHLQTATETGGAGTAQENRQIADQVVRGAFEFARARATAIAKQNRPASDAQSPDVTESESVTQLAAQADKEVKGLEGELETSHRKLESSSGKARQAVLSLIAETQSELDLAKAKRDALRSMLDFLASTTVSGPGATGLQAQIEARARSVPGELTKPLGSSDASHSGAATARPADLPAPTPIVAAKPDPPGIWSLLIDLFNLSRRLQALDSAIQSTDALEQTSKQLRTPLVAKLLELTKEGDELAVAADTAGKSTLDQYKQDLDHLTAEFKQVSAANLPLSKQAVLLSVYQRGLSSWETEMRGRFASERRNLLVRLAALLLLIAALFVVSRFGRRAILRYVHDVRRRSQFLLLRKLVLWFTIAIIVGFSFAGEIGSVATFAGLLTAGVAVALQNVIVSIAGYFFLIGKLGIRVGDKVQISGVTGEVVEIGLVRIHLMELSAGAPEIPTGRVVAFSNSIVFQPGVGLFKQIPGTTFRWHEVTVTLPAETDSSVARERMQEGVEAAFADYQADMTKQSRHMEETFSATSVKELRPKIRVNFTAAGLEVVVRYPIDSRHGSEIDERVTAELLKAVDREPKLRTAGTAVNLKLRTDLMV